VSTPGESLALMGDITHKEELMKNDSSLSDVIETSMENQNDTSLKKKNLETILDQDEQVKGLNELVPNNDQELDD